MTRLDMPVLPLNFSHLPFYNEYAGISWLTGAQA
jgi:hypothetical protein